MTLHYNVWDPRPAIPKQIPGRSLSPTETAGGRVTHLYHQAMTTPELSSSLERGPWSSPSPSLVFGTITFLGRIQLPEATWRPEVGASRRLGIL